MEQGRDENRQQQQPPQQNQKCPRCDSFNTKFCYFNNYSLSQPRHFCKTCKRYWTQGGTFRNIPIGGSSRKAKRARTCSSSSSSSSSLSFNYSQPQQPQPHLTRPSPTVVHSTTLGGGYLSSLTGLRSLNPSQPFSESLKAVTGSSNLSLLSGFNAASLTPRFYQIGNRERVNSLFPSEQGLVPSSVGNNSSVVNNSYSDRWPQNLVNNATNQRVSLWSAINANSSIIGNSDQSNVRVASSSFNPNLLPGYGPPPQ